MPLTYNGTLYVPALLVLHSDWLSVKEAFAGFGGMVIS